MQEHTCKGTCAHHTHKGRSTGPHAPATRSGAHTQGHTHRAHVQGTHARATGTGHTHARPHAQGTHRGTGTRHTCRDRPAGCRVHLRLHHLSTNAGGEEWRRGHRPPGASPQTAPTEATAPACKVPARQVRSTGLQATWSRDMQAFGQPAQGGGVWGGGWEGGWGGVRIPQIELQRLQPHLLHRKPLVPCPLRVPVPSTYPVQTFLYHQPCLFHQIPHGGLWPSSLDAIQSHWI